MQSGFLGQGRVCIKKKNLPLKPVLKCLENSLFLSDFHDMKIMNHGLQTPRENFHKKSHSKATTSAEGGYHPLVVLSQSWCDHSG